MVYFIWFMWLVMQMFLSVILLNFLIAIISQSYEEVMNQNVINKLKQKCQLNEETFGFINFFIGFKHSERWSLDKFNVGNSGIYIVSTNYTQVANCEWTGFVSKIQKTIKSEVVTVKKDIAELATTQAAQKEELKTLIEGVKKDVLAAVKAIKPAEKAEE
jgi:hypothetical protein